MLLLGMVIGALIMYFCFNRITPSQRYRKVLTDMFVAGKVRKVAKDHDIDLSLEFEDYKAFVKKQAMFSYSLDDSIELELQDEIDSSMKKDTKKK